MTEAARKCGYCPRADLLLLGEVAVKQSRLAELEKAERELEALHAHGVDNWEGFGDAMEELRNDRHE